jgi:hypothetical protein
VGAKLTKFVNEERNTQNAIVLLNYLKRIALQQLCKAKNSSFRKDIFEAQRMQVQLFKRKRLILRKFIMFTGCEPWITGFLNSGLN